MSGKRKSNLKKAGNKKIVPVAKQRKARKIKFAELLAMDKVIPMKTKKGKAKADAIKLIIEKLGITKNEMKAIKKNSIEYARTRVRQLEKIIKANKSNFKDLSDAPVYYGGSSLAPQTVPDFPANVFIPSDNRERHSANVVHAEGDGDGWITQSIGGNADEHVYFITDYSFTFMPPQATSYSFAAIAKCAAPYYIFADDGFWTSKEALIYIWLDMRIDQDIPQPFEEPERVTTKMKTIIFFQEGDDNIDRAGNINVEKTAFTGDIFSFANIPITITVTLSCVVMGKGEGSVANLHLEDPLGGFICDGLLVTAVTN